MLIQISLSPAWLVSVFANQRSLSLRQRLQESARRHRSAFLERLRRKSARRQARQLAEGKTTDTQRTPLNQT